MRDSKATGKQGENCDSDSGATKSATSAVSESVELRELVNAWDGLANDAKVAILSVFRQMQDRFSI